MIEWIGQNLSLFLLLAGAALVIAEAFAPGAHFIVLGVALLVAGLVGVFLPAGMGVVAPAILAGLVLGVGALTLYVYRQFDFYGGKGGPQTSDSDSLRGETGRVTERVTTTGGQVKLDEGGFNPFYQARSVDGEIPVGTQVMVTDPGGGNVVTVESMTGGVDEIDRALARERRTDGEATDDGSDDETADGETADDETADDAGRSEDADQSSTDGERDREFEPDTA